MKYVERSNTMEHKQTFKVVLITLIAVGLTVGFGYGISKAVKTSDSPASSASKSSNVPIMVPGNFTELAEKARPGVVNIQTVKTVKGGGRVFRHFFGNPFGGQNPFSGRQNPFDGGNPFEDFFGPQTDDGPSDNFQQKSLGSGFIIDREGHIVTNNHVVDGADGVKVKLADGKEFDAKVIGRDSKTDLALIKISGSSDLQPLKMGNSDETKVGSWVVAIGSPFGLEQTVTAGIVSAKGRIIGSGPYDNFIQTDASINPGNSGGPLINMNGEVIGINTAIVASGQGIGFAIPVNMAVDVIPQLKNKGRVTRGWLGVAIQDITPELAKSFGLKEKKGALVADVVKDGPAEKAGIERGDVIVEFDGKEVAESKDLPRIVASVPVGKNVTIKLLKDGKAITKNVKIAQMEETTAKVAEGPVRKQIGITVQNITPEIGRALGLKNTNGAVITQVESGSPASDAGLQRGDVIKEVNRKTIKNADECLQNIEQAKKGNDSGSVLLLIQRNESSLYIAVTLR
jgi:serine protease Do